MPIEAKTFTIRNPFDCIGRIVRGASVDDFDSMLCIDDPAEWLAVIGGAAAAVGAYSAMLTTPHQQNESSRIVHQLAKLDCVVGELIPDEEEESERREYVAEMIAGE